MAEEREPEMTENMATTPPTTLYIPKSSTPKVCKMTREVYKLTAIINNMRIYNSKVFFAILLLFCEVFTIKDEIQ